MYFHKSSHSERPPDMSGKKLVGPINISVSAVRLSGKKSGIRYLDMFKQFSLCMIFMHRFLFPISRVYAVCID